MTYPALSDKAVASLRSALAQRTSSDEITAMISAGGAIADVVFTIGADAGTTVAMQMQFRDALGNNLAVRGSVFAYLSDDAFGDSIVAAAPSGGWAIGTDGLLIPVVAGKAANFTSKATGHIDFVITEAGAKTLYLAVRLPNGALKVSPVITFV